MMKRPLLLLSLLAACAAPKASAPAPVVATAGSATDDGFQTLFDGGAIEGWVQAGPGRMVIENGLARTEGGMGLWYFEKKRFKDFVLRLQFRQVRPNANA